MCLCVSVLRRGRAGYMPALGRSAAAPERPWDPSASFQLRRCTRVGSPWIKRRSVAPNRANKWQMLWISLSSVTTEGLKGPRDCFHMKAASEQNHGKPLPTLRTGWNWDVWSLHMYTNKNTNRHTKAGFEWFICLAHGSTEPALEIKCAVLNASEPERDILHFLRCWNSLVWASLKSHTVL